MKVAVLIDGGFTRVLARKDGHSYNPDFIENLAHCVVSDRETLLRALYYDCEPFTGTVQLPVSGEDKEFSKSGKWLDDLARKDFFAVRKGVLKFRGFKPRKIPVSGRALSDQDFAPDFEQKGVDMRIGLDMATLSNGPKVERIVLISNDTDCVPAMKHARKAGVQLVLGVPPNQSPAHELAMHSDLTRTFAWPGRTQPKAPQ
ncbi:conserved hypothetical protein [Maricaulis maris MCS10]|uniref:NYN domain-containing protein n=1 Tax=Maricaulis maris (strain MCS10) TaxID=394221 RepID=Q0AMI9_MARMM|nr:NYN domain-containing protein [Maricaulis maris]ABI66504.1 conserved hypothetical protein [Maricaulis maris MCS10]